MKPRKFNLEGKDVSEATFLKGIKAGKGGRSYIDPQPQHTPTPWRANYGDIHTAFQLDSIHIGKCANPNNAAFIVRAVNSHEALLAFAKIFIKGECDQDVMESIAEKAIAKAEGRL